MLPAAAGAGGAGGGRNETLRAALRRLNVTRPLLPDDGG